MGAVGLAVGVGQYFLALVATVVTFAVMEYARRTKHKSQQPGAPPGPGTP
jgi:uncharacterized membrane protein YhiD involved in acid resistance